MTQDGFHCTLIASKGFVAVSVLLNSRIEEDRTHMAYFDYFIQRGVKKHGTAPKDIHETVEETLEIICKKLKSKYLTETKDEEI